jgi:hypothetical protein
VFRGQLIKRRYIQPSRPFGHIPKYLSHTKTGFSEGQKHSRHSEHEVVTDYYGTGTKPNLVLNFAHCSFNRSQLSALRHGRTFGQIQQDVQSGIAAELPPQYW